MEIRKLFILLVLPWLFLSCRMDDKLMEQNKEKSISILRYDRLQNEYVRFNSLSALQRMNTQYSHLTQILIEDIIAIGQVSDESINEKYQAFYSDTTLLSLMEDVETRFQNIERLEKQLSNGFRKLIKEVPQLRIPRIYTQISALNESVVIADTLMGISLDKYMGEDYPLYNRYYYEYQRRTMRPDRIAPDCFTYYLLSYYPLPMTSNRNLLENMIHTGKLNYIIKQILDYDSSEDVMGYSDEEKKWCRENKKKVWEYMLSNEQMYTTDPMVIRRYLRPYPSSDFFGENSPGLIGVWIGTEIVSSFMKNNKDISIKELLDITDYELLLNESRFKP